MLHRGAPGQEGRLDQAQSVLAQGPGIGTLLGQRRQGMTQGVRIDQRRQRQFGDGLLQAHQGVPANIGRGSGAWVRITTPQAMRAPDSPIGWLR